MLSYGWHLMRITIFVISLCLVLHLCGVWNFICCSPFQFVKIGNTSIWCAFLCQNAAMQNEWKGNYGQCFSFQSRHVNVECVCECVCAYEMHAWAFMLCKCQYKMHFLYRSWILRPYNHLICIPFRCLKLSNGDTHLCHFICACNAVINKLSSRHA